MTFLSNISSVTVGVSLALLSTASMADTQVTANAGLYNLQFQLVDLNPNDGIDAAITYYNSSNVADTYVQNGLGNLPEVVSESKRENSLGPVYSAATLPGAAAFSSGDLFGLVNTKGYQNREGYFLTNQTIFTNFSLTANTLLMVSGDIAGQISVGEPGNPDYLAQSFAFLNIFGLTPPENGGPQMAGIDRRWMLDGNQGSYEHFSLRFVNDNASTIEGALATQSLSFGLSPAAPVPEPESWAMLGAGLFGLGMMTRWRKRQA